MNRYKTISILKNPSGKRYYAGVRYPEIAYRDTDFYVIAQEGDRYDLYANQYYRDSSLWWIISISNGTLTQNSLTPPVGSQIRIPSNPNPIIAEFETINK